MSDDYRNGFIDGMNVDSKYPMTLSIRGYDLNKLMEIINYYENNKHLPRQKREEFRAKFAAVGHSEETVFSSRVLEAYDLVHCPELRKDQPVFEIRSENKPSIKIWADGRTEGAEGVVVNRIPQLIELISKTNQK